MSTQMVPMPLPGPQTASSDPVIAPARFVCFGVFHLDLKNEQLFREDKPIKLQGKVQQVLLALLQKPGQIVTREELRAHLWPSGSHVNYDANVNTTVNKLRQLLGDSPDQPVYVETIPRKGYSFVASIEYANRPRAPRVLKSEPKAPATVSPAIEHAEGWSSLFWTAHLSQWFTAGIVTLVIASMLFGAALVLYAHR